MIQVPLQRPLPRRRQPVIRARHASFERLGAANVARLLQFARVDAQISVGCILAVALGFSGVGYQLYAQSQAAVTGL